MGLDDGIVMSGFTQLDTHVHDVGNTSQKWTTDLYSLSILV